MKIVIDIPERYYKQIKDNYFGETIGLLNIMIMSIVNGTPLPEGHGDLIDKEKLKENINDWYVFMKDVCKQPYMTLKQEEIIGKIDMMTPIIEAEGEE